MPMADIRQGEWLPLFLKPDNQLSDNNLRMAEDEKFDSRITIRLPEAMRARLRDRAARLPRSPRPGPDGREAQYAREVLERDLLGAEDSEPGTLTRDERAALEIFRDLRDNHPDVGAVITRAARTLRDHSDLLPAFELVVAGLERVSAQRSRAPRSTPDQGDVQETHRAR